MVSSKDAEIFREDARLRGKKLTPAEREKLLKPYLPEPAKEEDMNTTKQARKSKSTKSKSKSKPTPIRTFLKSQIHRLIYVLIHLCLGFYIRITQTIAAVTDRVLAVTYYHHRSPELIARDVKGLSRLPEHLSVLLKLRKREEDALQTLMDETAELAAWTTCAGIPVLSVYEKTAISDKLALYYGSPSNQPHLCICAPHHSSYAPASHIKSKGQKKPSLTVLLLSHSDGRETLVDLTKTLTEMAQSGKLSPNDISTKLIDAEISELTSCLSSSSSSSSPPSPPPASSSVPNESYSDNDTEMLPSSLFHPIKPEPDLLIIFGPIVRLEGYPPWQVRLTEIFCTGDKTSSIAGGNEEVTVEYQGFLRALWRYARASFRYGR
ncbi:conserved hypothetical protein [Talaromyces stipitatus ATCC 10500]|uniref:ditrans,polycis-polyprenyl diphosphate synthase [(2E,6E)-farnesyldiphosphate specific] n=1 Tax=Talaromyces stipitatus (strain ATCC 10500 / CBS 375.48 / QM 6759 / NRRL 1006) TaxID=441959 RepID=B8MG69_TALSN|nr:uncharacterized protein TSTA_010530 [Talaromyces stipitatus ATCC 10500]EED15936.1 conserved hypothetical protein [Talaromyces stipitatus ATCC 10500]